MARINKSYRFESDVVKILSEMVKDSGHSETSFLEWAIRNIHKSFQYERHTKKSEASIQHEEGQPVDKLTKVFTPVVISSENVLVKFHLSKSFEDKNHVKHGPYSIGEVVSLPKDQAEFLIEAGVASMVRRDHLK